MEVELLVPIQLVLGHVTEKLKLNEPDQAMLETRVNAELVNV